MKYTIRYDDKDGSLWAAANGVNYMISQSSGELVGADGHRISDLYWSDIPNGSAEVVKNIFSDIAAQAATIAQLRELVKLAEEFHADVMVATSVRGKEPNFTTANETWLKFSRAARALKGGE